MQQPIRVFCSHCEQQLRVAGATVGRQVRCPRCHGFIQVPESSGPAGGGGPSLWVVRDETGKIYGPVSREDLVVWIGEGRVHSRSQISPEGAERWMWAGEMFPQLATAPKVAPAPRQSPAPIGPVGVVSQRSRLAAGLLGLLLPLAGIHGVHRLYLGHIGLGILMMITFGGCGIWQLIDVILVFAGSVRDSEGLPLRD